MSEDPIAYTGLINRAEYSDSLRRIRAAMQAFDEKPRHKRRIQWGDDYSLKEDKAVRAADPAAMAAWRATYRLECERKLRQRAATARISALLKRED